MSQLNIISKDVTELYMNLFFLFLLLTNKAFFQDFSSKHVMNGGRPFLIPALKEEKMQTPISEKDLLKVLESSHVEVFGYEPKRRRLAMALAQISFENGRGKKVWNYNLGNIGPMKRNEEYYNHKKFGWPYRSFSSFSEGAIAYWKTIKNCYSGLQYFDSGDPALAAVGLKKCNYFQASIDDYAKNLTSLFNEAYYRIVPSFYDERRKESN